MVENAGENLRRLMAERGLSTKDLIEMTGIFYVQSQCCFNDTALLGTGVYADDIGPRLTDLGRQVRQQSHAIHGFHQQIDRKGFRRLLRPFHLDSSVR